MNQNQRWRLLLASIVLGLLITAGCDVPPRAASSSDAEPTTQATAEPAAAESTTPEATSVAESADDASAEAAETETATPEIASCDVLWEELLVEYGEDYSECTLPEVDEAEACEPPEVINATGVELRETVNIELILDSSGSMAGEVPGGVKMDAAKQTLTEFANSLPEEFNVALRVYGHTGSNQEADRALSCQGTELLYDFAPSDSAQFDQAIASFQPTGWTPIAGSLQAAQADFAGFDLATNTNFVYLVSDGIETCDGDPVAAAQSLRESDVAPIVNVIGFGVDAEAQQQLQAVAQAGGGVYYSANSAAEIKAIFETSVNFVDYYACAYGSATAEYSQSLSAIYGWYTCNLRKANTEYAALISDLNDGYFGDDPQYDACYGELTDRNSTRYDGIVEPLQAGQSAGADEARQKYEEAQTAINEVMSENPNRGE